MRKAWAIFFMVWPVLAILTFLVAPGNNWWFPGDPISTVGARIDDLFNLIMAITGVAFVLTQMVLGYVLWKGAELNEKKAWFVHGSHNLEVIWTIIPAAVMLFISLYQMNVLAEIRVKSQFPEEAREHPIAEVTARQFEWRIRYPAPGETLKATPQPGDLYTVNDLHVPAGKPVMIWLKSLDVQHGFGLPHARIMQDALPGRVIPVWFQVDKTGTFEIVCKELCGWGHYKMRGQLVAELEDEVQAYMKELQRKQLDDGFPAVGEAGAAEDVEDGQ